MKALPVEVPVSDRLPPLIVTTPATLARLMPALPPLVIVADTLLQVQPPAPVVVLVTSTPVPPVALIVCADPVRSTVPLLLATKPRALLVVRLMVFAKVIVPVFVVRKTLSAVWPVPVRVEPPLKVTLPPVRFWMLS